MTTVLVIDPGETSGWAVANGEEKKVIAVGEMKLWHKLNELIEKYKPEYIVYESFSLYPWAAKSLAWSSFPTIEVIGVIKYCAERDGITLIAQTPADRKKAHIYVNFKSAHVRSAVRHAVVFVRSYFK